VDRSPICIDTRHELNIFGVEFLPCTGSSMVISAAYDRMVQLHRLDRTSVPTAGPYRPFSGGSAPIATQSVRCHTQVFTNHSESVKVCFLIPFELQSNRAQRVSTSTV
jgi:WD and tetratricopeptide repeats protein 1